MWGRRRDNSEKGIALVEFAISLPFLVAVTTAIADIAAMMNQYMLLTNAVHSGVRAATGLSNLEPGTFRGLSSGQAGDCARQGTSLAHEEVQARVVELIQLSNRRVRLETLCITTGVVTAAGPEQNTVYVNAQVRYQSWFPAFNDWPITVEAKGPFLSS